MDFKLVVLPCFLIFFICSAYSRNVPEEIDELLDVLMKSDEKNEEEDGDDKCGVDGDNDVVDNLLCVNSEIKGENSYILTKGDVMLNNHQYYQGREINENVQADLTTMTAKHWPKTKDVNGNTIVIIPYVYDDYGGAEGRVVTQRVKDIFQQAINEYKEKTCIRFQPRKHEHNYIRVVNDDGCYSFVGMQPYPQKLSLQDKGYGRGCFFTGVAIHETMHALGWFHEQSRMDRDNYIEIRWENIMDEMKHNFYAENTDYQDLEYDINSIMHYGPFSFSKNRLPTIVKKGSGDLSGIGQRHGFSELDLAAINKFYCAQDDETPGPPPVNPVVTLPEQKVVCPFVRKGGLCRFCTLCTYCEEQCNFNSESVGTHCDYWATQGLCKDGNYVDYMSKECPKSCKRWYCEK